MNLRKNLIKIIAILMLLSPCGAGLCNEWILPSSSYQNIESSPTDYYDFYIHNLAENAVKQLPEGYFSQKSLFQRQIEMQCGFLVNELNAMENVPSDEEIKFILKTAAETVFNVIFNVLDAGVPQGYLENLPFSAAHKAMFTILEELKKSPAPTQKVIKEKVKQVVKAAYQKDLCDFQKNHANIGNYPTFSKAMLDKAIKLSNEKYFELDFSDVNDSNLGTKTEKDALALVSIPNRDYKRFSDYKNGIKKDEKGRIVGRIIQGYFDGIDDVLGWEEYAYDAENNLKTVKRKNYDSDFPNNTGESTFFYNKDKKIEKSVDVILNSAHFESFYEYSDLGKIIRTQISTDNYNKGEKTVYTYVFDNNGQIFSTNINRKDYIESIIYNFDKGAILEKSNIKFKHDGNYLYQTLSTFKDNKLVQKRQEQVLGAPEHDIVEDYEYYDSGVLKMIVKTTPNEKTWEKTFIGFNPDGEIEYNLTMTIDRTTNLLVYGNNYGCCVRLIMNNKLLRYNQNLELQEEIDY